MSRIELHFVDTQCMCDVVIVCEMAQFSMSVGAQFDIIGWLGYQRQCKQCTHALLAVELGNIHAQ